MAFGNVIKNLYCLFVVIILSSLEIRGCSYNEFRCNDGQCIELTKFCNGQVNCYDGSAEVSELCGQRTNPRFNSEYVTSTPRIQRATTPSVEKRSTARFSCEVGEFSCLSGECIKQSLACDDKKDCRDGSDESSSICLTKEPKPKSEFDINFNSKLVSCQLPPQPENGNWKFDKSLCTMNRSCDPPPTLKEMQPGSHLVYSCHQNYRLNGSSDVLCGPGRKWVKIPTCEEIRCDGLNDATREAHCTLHNEKVACNVPVSAETKATLKCRINHAEKVTNIGTSKNVICQADGKWSPEPISCSITSHKDRRIEEDAVFVERENKQNDE